MGEEAGGKGEIHSRNLIEIQAGGEHFPRLWGRYIFAKWQILLGDLPPPRNDYSLYALRNTRPNGLQTFYVF